MGAYNPLIDGVAYAATPPAPADAQQQVTPTQNVSAMQGTLPLSGPHNTPLHVAVIAIVALLVVIGIRALDFRFSAIGKIGKG